MYEHKKEKNDIVITSVNYVIKLASEIFSFNQKYITKSVKTCNLPFTYNLWQFYLIINIQFIYENLVFRNERLPLGEFRANCTCDDSAK